MPAAANKKSVCIKVEGLKKSYYGTGRSCKSCCSTKKEESERNQLKGVSFEVNENEVLAILGQSGAGKTTLFKMLSMADQRSAGSISMFGHNFSEVNDPTELIREG